MTLKKMLREEIKELEEIEDVKHWELSDRIFYDAREEDDKDFTLDELVFLIRPSKCFGYKRLRARR